jgi:hypothetical protein
MVDREPSALLAAGTNASREKIQSLRKILESDGMLCIPVSHEGQNLLHVTGFKTPEEVLSLIRENGFVSGEPDVTNEVVSTQEKNTNPSFLKRYSLKLAGVLNMIGDVGLLSKGLTGGGAFTAAAGGFYTMGGANLAIFGNAKPMHSPVMDRVATFIGSKIENPSLHPGLSELMKGNASIKSKLNNNLKKHTADITLAAYSVGAATMLAQGIKEFREERIKLASKQIDSSQTQGWSLIGYGISSLTFKLLSLIIPEKSPDDALANDEPRGVARRCVDWVREKPMRLFGYGSLITDTMLAIRAYQEFKANKALPADIQAKKNYLWTALTAVTYMASDFLAAISSKNKEPSKLSVDEQRSVVALAAETIALQPKEKQDTLASEIAGYLEAQPEMSSKGKLGELIRKQMKNMENSPWAMRLESAPTLEASR